VSHLKVALAAKCRNALSTCYSADSTGLSVLQITSLTDRVPTHYLRNIPSPYTRIILTATSRYNSRSYSYVSMHQHLEIFWGARGFSPTYNLRCCWPLQVISAVSCFVSICKPMAGFPDWGSRGFPQTLNALKQATSVSIHILSNPLSAITRPLDFI
jgi:hypothetical protein